MKKLLLLQLLICGGFISSALEKRDVHRIILKEAGPKRKPHRSPSHHRHYKHHKNHGHDFISEEYDSYDSLQSSEESNYKYKDFPLPKPIKNQSYSHLNGQKHRNKRQKHRREPDQLASSSTSFSVHHRYPSRNHRTKSKDFFDNSYFPLTGQSDHFSAFTFNPKVGTSTESGFVPSNFGFGTSFVKKNATSYQVYEEFPPFTEKSITLAPPLSFNSHGEKDFDDVNIVHENLRGSKRNKQSNKKNAAIRQRRKKKKKSQ